MNRYDFGDPCFSSSAAVGSNILVFSEMSQQVLDALASNLLEEFMFPSGWFVKCVTVTFHLAPHF